MPNEERRRWTLMFSLARVSLLIVATAAALGWAASFVGLHDYGVRQLYGFTPVTAWFIPGAIDGAAFATSLMTYRANIKGRAAVRGRLLMWAFTAASGWINWIHQISPEARFVAAGLPVAAVAVFDVVLIELRADFEERHGRRAFRLRPGLLALRWMVDRRGTGEAFRRQIEAIPVASLAGLGNDLMTDAAQRGHVVPKAWHNLPQAHVKPASAQRALQKALAERRARGLIVPTEWHDLPHAETPRLPAPRAELTFVPTVTQSALDESLPFYPQPELPQSSTSDITGDATGYTTGDATGYTSGDATGYTTGDATADITADTADQSAAETPADNTSTWTSTQPTSTHEEPIHEAEETARIPQIAREEQIDEREAARELVRRNPSDWTGRSLGNQFGKSPSWGRTQIQAVRQELEQQRREEHERPKLVAVDS